mgnify:FL=1
MYVSCYAIRYIFCRHLLGSIHGHIIDIFVSAFQHAAAFRYIAQFSAIGEPDLDELFPAYVLRGQQGFISHGVARGGGRHNGGA